MAQAKPGALVIGTGFGILTHARALREAGFDVVGLVGRNPEKTAKRAKLFDIPNALTSVPDALALPGVDVVCVTTPPHSHAEIAIAAAEAGKHVVCEKPFARDADEGRQMLEAVEKAGVIHLLGCEFRYSTGQALATRAVQEGQIGEPRLATFMLHMPGVSDPAGEVPAWWGVASEGGGWLGAYASHVVDQVRVTLGEISGVSASLTLLSNHDWTAEDSYTIHFRTTTGVDGVLQSTAGSWGPPATCARIAGSKGTLIIEGDTVSIAAATGQRTLDVPDDLRNPAPNPPPAELLVTQYDMLHSMGIDIGPFTKLFGALRTCMDGGELPTDPAPATFVDGLRGQQVLDAIRKSSVDHAWVPIAEGRNATAANGRT